MGVPTKYLSDEELAAAITAAGFEGDEAIVVFAIIIGESAGNVYAINLVDNPESPAHLSLDRGIVQWNSYWWEDMTNPRAFDPTTAIAKMRQVVDDTSDLLLWAAFKNLTFVRHIERAKAAFA